MKMTGGRPATAGLVGLAGMVLSVVPLAQDRDLSPAFEGDRLKRQRLEGLEGPGKAPPLKVEAWANCEGFVLENLEGKIVVLDFWATWCRPCLRAVPHTNELAKKYQDDVVFIGVCATRGADKMEEMVRKYGIKYPVCKDVRNLTNESYEVNGFPDYYIIDRQGRIAVADCANAKVEWVIETLLEEESS